MTLESIPEHLQRPHLRPLQPIPTPNTPTTYTKELADYLCERLANGESMRSVCRDDSTPAMSTVFKWIREIDEFSQQYDRAKLESADVLVEDMLDIADNQAAQEVEIDGNKTSAVTAVGVSHAKLRVDTRKWAASKLKPKKYGDRLQSDVNLDATIKATTKNINLEMSQEEATQLYQEIINA